MKTNLLCIGSCRSASLPSKKYNIINFGYTHTTKEAIQLLSYAYKSTEEQKKIMSQEDILSHMSIKNFNDFKSLCENCDTILIEISSIKEIQNVEGFYFNQWVVRDNIIGKKEHIEKNLKYSIASVEDIKNDIEIIKNMLKNKILIFQTHFNLNFEGMKSLNHIDIIPPIEARNTIDKAVLEISNIKKIIPRNVFENINWKDIVLSLEDTCHLNDLGKNMLAMTLDNI